MNKPVGDYPIMVKISNSHQQQLVAIGHNLLIDFWLPSQTFLKIVVFLKQIIFNAPATTAHGNYAQTLLLSSTARYCYKGYGATP